MKTNPKAKVRVLAVKNRQEMDPSNPAHLIQLAIENKADINQLKELMQLQAIWLKQQAEQQFNLAMSRFQRDCPDIKKTKAVRNKHQVELYKFTPLGEITKQVKPILSANGLFYDFSTDQSEKTLLKVICTVTHEKGHSKDTSFTIPIGEEEYMTEPQKYGARLSFAKRYALCNALGIVTADEDNDGAKTAGEIKNEFPDADRQTIKEELLLMNTEKEVFDYVLKWDKYKNIEAFKNMIRIRITQIPAKLRMTETERAAYKAEHKANINLP